MALPTRSTSTWVRRHPVHVVFFSCFPSLSLLAHNIREVSATAVVRPLLASLGLAFLVYGP